MKAILISIKPKWVAKILNGEKTIEIRKTMPKCDLPIGVYIYCTKDKERLVDLRDDNFYFGGSERLNGKVVACFTLKKVEKFYMKRIISWVSNHITKKSCLTKYELYDYIGDKTGYAWHISNLVIFDKPKELSEFEKAGSYNNPTIKCKKKEQGRCNYGKSEFTGKWVGCEKARLTKAPQSYCYVEVEK